MAGLKAGGAADFAGDGLLRRLPHNVEAERALLGAILVDNRVFPTISGRLQPEHFVLQEHAQVFEAIVRLIERGGVADPVTLKGWAEAERAVAAEGGQRFLVALADAAVITPVASSYAQQLVADWQRRELIVLGEDTIARAYAGREAPEDIAAAAIRLISGIAATGAEALSEPEAADAGDVDTEGGINLPAEFWGARRWLTDLRAYAGSRRLDPDLLLGAVLARIAALVPAGTGFDTGVHSDRASLNLLVAGVGPSGAGKSGALSAAEAIVPVPDRLDFVEGPLGSGEGLAEAFMGDAPLPDQPSKGGKLVTERRQVRRNALFHLDEGEALFRLSAQATNTTLQTLRSVAMGRAIGTLNASAERRRRVRDYHAGVFVGWQPATIGPLLADVPGGTPQRFLFLSSGPRPTHRPACTAVPKLDLPPHFVPVAFPAHLKDKIARLLDEHDDAVLNSTDADWESHAVFMRAKLAALLCVIECRQRVTDDDWRLAGILVDTSRRVRDWLRRAAERQSEADRQTRIEERAATAEAAAALACCSSPAWR